MSPFHALILGIVEGITEFLPISSTGHLIVTSKLLAVPQTEALKSFEIAIQLGAILAVLVLYGKKLLLDIEVFKRVAVAFIPTGILGLMLYKAVKRFLLSSDTTVLWAMFLGGVVLVLFERFHREGKDSATDIHLMTYRQAATVGAAQALAMIPGVSRSAATVVGGMVMGISRRTIVEFSFLLAVPTMVAAAGLDLAKSAGAFSSSDVAALAIGATSAFAVALLSIRWLLRYVRSNSFAAFGMYRIAAAAVFLFLLR
jgi:undecaprenyl-diphosphatase